MIVKGNWGITKEEVKGKREKRKSVVLCFLNQSVKLVYGG